MALYGLTIYILTDSPIQINTIRMGLLSGHRSEFPNSDVLKSLKIVLTSAKSVEPGSSQFAKVPLYGFREYKGLNRIPGH